MQLWIIPGTAKTKGHQINLKNSETRLCFATTVMHKTLLIKTVLIKCLDERFKDAFFAAFHHSTHHAFNNLPT